MPIEVTMPRLSDTMEQGTVVKWNVKEGDTVKTGDVLADIETDKATMELQSFDEGTVAKLAVPEGQTVKIGQVILVLAGQGENVEQVRGAAASGAGSAGAKAASKEPSKRAVQGGTASSDEGGVGTAVAEPRTGGNGRGGRDEGSTANGAGSMIEPRGRVFASPLARKIADEAGVDLGRVEGTGPSGRITRKDVESAMAQGAPAGAMPTAPAGRGAQRGVSGLTAAHVPATPAVMVPPPGAMLAGRVVPLSNMRRTIAKRLVESKTTIPHYQVTVEVLMDALLSLRKQLNEQLESQGVKLSVNDFLVRACALAMHQHPFVNSRWIEKGGEAAVEIIGDVNIGIAIALPEERGGGLVVATIRNADRLGLRGISAQSKALADKARTKGLTVEEMADSTFTISNLGMFGVDHFTAIINPPNVAILAVGAAMERPVVRDGQLAVGSVMSMTMSSDHRVVDGAMAAQYLATVKQMLEKPATLLV
jgi:pyruvate dehydrogenase E2 component (dihydrolipoyllysine-residue acetyltransferase)